MEDQLKQVFEEVGISHTKNDLKMAEEMIIRSKQVGYDALSTSICVLDELLIGPAFNVLEFKKALITHGIFKN
jgi:hypothetical protein